MERAKMREFQKQRGEAFAFVFTGAVQLISSFLVLMLSIVAVAGSWTWAFGIPPAARVVMFATGVFGFVAAAFGFVGGNYTIRRACFPLAFAGSLIVLSWDLLLLYLLSLWTVPILQLAGFLLASLILGLAITSAVFIGVEGRKFR